MNINAPVKHGMAIFVSCAVSFTVILSYLCTKAYSTAEVFSATQSANVQDSDLDITDFN